MNENETPERNMHARFLHLLQAVTTVWVLVTLPGYGSAALVYTYIGITAVMDLIIRRSLSLPFVILPSPHHVTLTINIITYMHAQNNHSRW